MCHVDVAIPYADVVKGNSCNEHIVIGGGESSGKIVYQAKEKDFEWLNRCVIGTLQGLQGN